VKAAILRPLAVLAVFAAAACQLSIEAQARPAAGMVSQRLAALQADVAVRAAPSLHAKTLEVVRARRPLTGEQTMLPVERAKRVAHRWWLEVLLPGRPNSHHGWIQGTSARNRWTPWRLVVDLGARRVSVFRSGRLVQSFPAVVGKPSTPTPAGSFFVEENLRLLSYAPGEPYALALSARSYVYSEFEGGPGQIAIHGTAGIGGTPGQAESHGCIRLATASIAWLGSRIGAGVPVKIVR
jgi:lipoprotein-anchoring transpeptidase ErfK/SrfK